MSIAEPNKIWWSADELAASGLPEMPGTKRGVNLLANRLDWKAQPGCAKRKSGRGGGWVFHWSVLPLAARRKLLKETALSVEVRPNTNAVWLQYDALSEGAKRKAKARLDALNLADTYYASGLSRVAAMEESAKVLGFSARSLYLWAGLIEGIEPKDHLAYLVPKNGIAKRNKSLTKNAREFLDYLKSLFLQLGGPSFSQSYRLAIKKAEREGWTTLIEKTARRRVESEVPRVTRVFAREGVSGLMRCFPAQIRDRSTLTAMEGVNADCHKIDVFVKWPNGTINRPQIIAFQDLYSGKILSWRVDNDPNKVMVMAAFGEMIEKWGIPKHCLFDNGHEFANKWMTAGAKTRFRFKIRDDDPIGVLPMMGIKVHWATPAHGQAKPIERAFRDFATDIAKDPRFHGAYTGNRPDAKPENYGSRAVPLETFLRVVDEGVLEHNAREGRLSPTARGRSFDQTFAESYASAPIRKATEEQRRLWLMGQEVTRLRKVNGQIRIYGNFYHSPWMSQRASEAVVARFDPEDLHSGLHIYANSGEYLGFAECQQKVGFFDLVGAKEEARRKRRIRNAEKEVLAAHRPHSIEEIADDLNEQTPVDQSLVASKVVTPEFRSIHRRRTPDYSTEQLNPEVEEVRKALILEMPTVSKENTAPVLVSDPQKNWLAAKDIEARAAAGKQVSMDEADWLSEYKETSEYQAQLHMHESFGNGNAG